MPRPLVHRVGVRPPDAEWGIMVADGAASWCRRMVDAFFPGLALMIAVFCFNLLATACATSSIRNGVHDGCE